MFTNPEFGCAAHTVKTTDDNACATLKRHYEQALQWLLDIGRAKAITVVTRRNDEDITRVDSVITIDRPDNSTVSYSIWQDVL